MGEHNWEVVEVVSGDLQAELLRGLLEAQGVPAILSQESAGRSLYPVTVGPLSEVEILVPSSSLEQALAILRAYHAGEFAEPDEPEPDEPGEAG